jgi:methylmalonyl-CoA/ethylmalonyl-CoA epimerase
MASNDFGLSAIEQIGAVAHDIDRAVTFYRDKLGMKLLFRAPPDLAFFDCNGIRLMLSPPSGPEFDHPSLIYYHVDDIQQAHSILTSRGVQFEQAPHLLADMGSYNLWLAEFRDSEGNFVGLMSHVAKES